MYIRDEAPPAMELPPPDYGDRSPGLLACAILGIVVSTLSVLIRFWSRHMVKSLPLWWDDWTMILTLIFSIAFLAENIHWTRIGLGKHFWMIPMEYAVDNATTDRVALVLYAASVWMIKISALTFYARIFSLSKTFRIALWSVGALCTTWWILLSIIPWTFCHPLSKSVDPFGPGTCDSSKNWYLSSAFINAFLDFIVLLLPLPAIWKLQMSMRKRIAIIGIFILGYASAFLSFARFVIIVHNPKMLRADGDLSWDLVPLLYLSILEAPLAILALCAPAMNQLLARILENRSWSSLFSSRNTSSGSGWAAKFSFKGRGSTQQSSASNGWETVDNSSTTAFHDPYTQRTAMKDNSIALDTIQVEHELHVSSHHENETKAI